MSLLGTLARRIPSSPTGFITDAVGTIFLLDPLTGLTINAETFHEHGLPGRCVKLAYLINSASNAKWFPDDGSGVLPTSPAVDGGNLIKFPTSAFQNLTASPTGLLMLMTSGAAKGQWRKLLGPSGTFSSTAQATINRSWNSALEGLPAAGDSFMLFHDIAWGKRVTIGAEYSAAGDTNVLTALPLLYDIGRDDGAGAIKATPTDNEPDQLLTFTNLGVTPGARESLNYYRAQPQTIDTRGLWGLKVWVQTIPSGLTVSCWATTT